MKNKRGLSAVITTLIMIALVIVLITIVWISVDRMAKGAMKGSESCFDIAGKVNINNAYTCWNGVELQFSISLKDINPDSVLVTVSSISMTKSYTIDGTIVTNVKNYGDATYMNVRRIELQTETGKGIYHVSKTGWEISSSTDTDFYMYYDNDHADNTDYIGVIGARTEVWDGNYKLVYHMPDLTTSTVEDSTSNSNDGTKISADNPAEATGKIGQGQDFDGSDYINIDTVNADVNVGAGTISGWGNMDNYASNAAESFIELWGDGSNRIFIEHYPDNAMKFYHIAAGTAKFVSIDVSAYSGWYHWTITWDENADEVKAYIDGVQAGETQTELGVFSGAPTISTIGMYYSGFEYWNGITDEVCISSVARNDAWNKGIYNSGNDTLLAYESEEEYVHPVPADFAHRIKLTIDNTKIDSTLTHFPVTVILSSTHGDVVFDELTSDANRKKIAFTKADGSTQLYGEIEKWDDANESAVIHVSRSGWEISSTADTDFYMYYDSSLNDNFAYIGDINSTPGESVWDSNFEGVWHLSQDPSGSAPQELDSTANSRDLTSQGTMLTADLVISKIGLGLDFEGTDDYLLKAATAVGIANAWTVEGIFKADDVTTGKSLFGFMPDTGGINVIQGGITTGSKIMSSLRTPLEIISKQLTETQQLILELIIII